MPTKAEYEAAYAAAMPIVEAEIADEESKLPVFVRPRVMQGIEQHKEQIAMVVRAITDAAVDAAEKKRKEGS